MKKLLVLLLILALSLSLIACGDCEEHTDSDKDGVCDECGAPEDTPSNIETTKVEF